MWRELIASLTSTYEFASPAADERIAAAGAALGVGLPADLQNLLRETDGFTGGYGEDIVWPLKQIITTNISFRSDTGFVDLYMSFDGLLFFGNHANGDQIAFSIQADGLIHRPDIFVWDHETDGRSWIAGTLEDYLKRYLTNESDDG